MVYAKISIAVLIIQTKIDEDKRWAGHGNGHDPGKKQKYNICSSALYSGSHGERYCVESID